jgi:hypothetical protein
VEEKPIPIIAIAIMVLVIDGASALLALVFALAVHLFGWWSDPFLAGFLAAALYGVNRQYRELRARKAQEARATIERI